MLPTRVIDEVPVPKPFVKPCEIVPPAAKAWLKLKPCQLVVLKPKLVKAFAPVVVKLLPKPYRDWETI